MINISNYNIITIKTKNVIQKHSKSAGINQFLVGGVWNPRSLISSKNEKKIMEVDDVL